MIMRSYQRAAAVAVMTAAILAPSVVPVVAQESAGEGGPLESPDGLVSLTIQAGDPTDGVTVTLRPPDELPLALSSWPDRPPHIDVEPHDVVFEGPARITRRVPLAQLGLPELDGPIPLGVLAIFAADGSWGWLDDATARIDADEAVLELSGEISHGGRIFAFSSGTLTVTVPAPTIATIGGGPVLEATLEVSPRSTATMTAVAGGTADETVAVAGAFFLTPMFGDQVASHHFACVGPGTTRVEGRSTVGGFGDDNPFTSALGLTGTSVDLVVSATLECEA